LKFRGPFKICLFTTRAENYLVFLENRVKLFTTFDRCNLVTVHHHMFRLFLVYGFKSWKKYPEK
jgi:hypothetical protein